MRRFYNQRRPRPARVQEPRSPLDPFTTEERQAFAVLLDEMGNRVIDALSLNPERPADELVREVRSELLTLLDTTDCHAQA